MTIEKSPVSLSVNAAKRITELCKKKGDMDLKFRVSVDGGGCSGFQYAFDLVKCHNEDDLIVERNGVTMVVDGMSLLYLTGSEVDFVEELAGSMFVIKNPNATASCGCGSSFSV